MVDFIRQLFDPTGFPARWHCGFWTGPHGWTHIIADWLIFGAYFAIPISIAVVAIKRREVHFPALYWLFAAFILCCGLGHLIESIIFWYPWYRLSAASKVLTAVVSWTTVIAAMRYLPAVVRLPGVLRLTRQLQHQIEEREKAEVQFQLLADTVPSLTFAADPTGHFEFVNERFTSVTGCTTEDLRDSGWKEVVHPDERNSIDQLWKKSLRQSDTFNAELRIRSKNGSYGWYLVKAVPVNSGSETRWIGCATDITEAKEKVARELEFERNVQEAQRLESLGVLAGGIAHDFNNLLTGIIGNTSMARGELPEDSPIRLALQRAELAAFRAAELCRQMLAYSGRGQFQVTEFDLTLLIREAAELVATSIHKKANLSFALAPDLPLMKGDPSQIRQVVMNLLINASESLEGECGEIAIRTGYLQVNAAEAAGWDPHHPHQAGEYIYLEVEDTGCGMPEEVVERMFEPFFSTKFTGRGLGLSAVQGIVRGHSGAIQVRSEAMKGTRIRVLFPALEASAKTEPAAETPLDETGADLPANILVVEDELEVIEALRGMLKKLAITPHIAVDGVEAIEMFQKFGEHFPIVLMDLTMPLMDGAESARRIKQLAPETKIVLMSGYDCETAARNLQEVKFDGLLQKPFDMPRLKQCLEAQVGRRHTVTTR